ncbi:hypothetical protein HAX54_018968 [Datura stramonium]|uniref:Uncharacterized protein n=1 Tax=Datura stramonium TaxID=4076 RepID=A0ABS8UQE1_DATST|nr:hypothetical protein [Datura stramonium]
MQTLEVTHNPVAKPFHGKITYKVGNKVICCLDGARIGIQYETSFAGESCDLYHCVLESKSFLEKMTVLEHTIDGNRFDIKELYGNQIGELYHSLPYHMIEFVLEDFDSKLTKGNGVGSHPIPARLTYAEDALRTMSLPEAYAEIVLNLSQALQDVFPHRSST